MNSETFEPCYGTECDNCGQSPTVTLINKEGKEINRWDMCGVCMWGESDCIDPDNWNI
jgi:hypothetical protein